MILKIKNLVIILTLVAIFKNSIVSSSSPLTVQPVFPQSEWETKIPSEVGMDGEILNQIQDYMGGWGVIVQNGYIVKSWGDISSRMDIASASKPFYSFFLTLAIKLGKLNNFDENVNKYQTCINEINPDLDHKDREMTFRHMANQISLYGVSEQPGSAYNYNDWQMALFWDTLFLDIYDASYDNVDEIVFDPYLNDIIQMQDDPTMMAFGLNDRQGRIAISVRDLARFGLLYLNGGQWNGNSLIAQEYVSMMTSCPVPNSIPRTIAVEAEMCDGQRTHGSKRLPDDQFDNDGSYSWLWWVNGLDNNGNRKWPDGPVDAYAALGHDSKRGMIVIPSLAIVIAWNETVLDSYPAEIDPINEILKLIQNSVNQALNNPTSLQMASQSENQLPDFCEYPFRINIPISVK